MRCRFAALKILSNPTVMSGLDMPAPMRKLLEREAQKFSKPKVEPIACFELASRKEARSMIGVYTENLKLGSIGSEVRQGGRLRL